MERPRYIDPTTDYGFKRIIASEVNKDLLIALLNGLFRGAEAGAKGQAQGMELRYQGRLCDCLDG